jgi:hypothetical protein
MLQIMESYNDVNKLKTHIYKIMRSTNQLITKNGNPHDGVYGSQE